MKTRCAHDLRQRDNVFMAIVLLCLISHIKYRESAERLWFRRIESPPANSGGALLLLAAGSDFLAFENGKGAPRTGFGEMTQALRSNLRVSRDRENPLSIFAKRFTMSDTIHRRDAFLRSLIRWFVFCGAMVTRAKLQTRHRLDCICPTQAEHGARLSEWP
jgi:hypothetical protein